MTRSLDLHSIDLNADLGESPDAGDVARDIALMDVVTSCNIACGGHAGNADSMTKMLQAASERGVHAGAHPSYPDRRNFGRTSLNIDAEALVESVLEQITALSDIAQRQGITLTHIKPHGALYNDLADNEAMAQNLAQAVYGRFPNLAQVGLAGGAMQPAAAKSGARFIAEAFVDRRYNDRGRLVSRGEAGAVLEADTARIEQALALARDGKVTTGDGGTIALKADSLCIHSDSPGAVDTARTVRAALDEFGIAVRAP